MGTSRATGFRVAGFVHHPSHRVSRGRATNVPTMINVLSRRESSTSRSATDAWLAVSVRVRAGRWACRRVLPCSTSSSVVEPRSADARHGAKPWRRPTGLACLRRSPTAPSIPNREKRDGSVRVTRATIEPHPTRRSSSIEAKATTYRGQPQAVGRRYPPQSSPVLRCQVRGR